VSAPARVVHLGLGAFARAHQAWYTHHAPDGADWPIAAFGGRSASLADALTASGGRYTLVTRAPDGDRFETITAITSAHGAGDTDAWLARLVDPATAVVTATVTEAGWHAAGPTSAPARLVAGLDARRRADAGPLAVVPCDNLPANGEVAARVVTDVAARADDDLASWIAEQVSFVSTVVDRITPRTTDADRGAVRSATGVDDPSPVVTEPFSEWVLAGAFPGGRPAWDAVGARLVDDVAPFARRKVWLLNGAHSLLAYLGSIRGHATVDAAVADEVCAAAVARWWSAAGGHLD
jgi:fructuronate reductase